VSPRKAGERLSERHPYPKPAGAVPAGRRAALIAKRALDIALAGGALLALAPLLAVIALAVWATAGRPILFRQVRPGRGTALFTLLKFRSMRAPAPGEVWLTSSEQRLSPFGRFLRTTSLDELPELWNVLVGDMSLVGPRPLLPEYLPEYSPDEQRRHTVRPGLTGWAVVNGRNSLPFRERLQLDVWYVEHWSLGLDLRILALTAWHVVRRTGTAPVEDSAALGFPLARLAGGTAAAPARPGEAPRTDGRSPDLGEPALPSAPP
jgi:lipopolysaccharide/colanic/teichoic acid biosynthesis glycosyltransferase